MSEHEYRICPRCDRELPLTEEWWYSSTVRSIEESVRAAFPRWCSNCYRVYFRERDPEERRSYQRSYYHDRMENDPKYRKFRQIDSNLRYNRKRGNLARVAELEAELEALRQEKES